jgi:hypothetical protein
MPSTTERQQITEALHKALLFHLITELEQDAESSDSSSSSSTSDDDSNTSDSEDEEGDSQMEDHIHSIAALYTNHYYNTHNAITKTGVNLQLLMEDYKFNRPEIFRSYLRITPDCFDNLVNRLLSMARNSPCSTLIKAKGNDPGVVSFNCGEKCTGEVMVFWLCPTTRNRLTLI